MTPAVKISKQLQAIAAELDARLEGVSTASREDSVHNLRQLLGQWETDAPDMPAEVN